MLVARSLKLEHVLDAATDLFTRYGYARTTMGDIAARASMSRPALYLLFSDKDAIFDGVIRRMDEAKLAAISGAIEHLDDMDAKLLLACLDWGMHGVSLAAAHPDAADLFDLRFTAVRQVYDNFEALVVQLIGPQAVRSGIAATPEELAHVLVFAMRGFRAASPDGSDMRRLIAVQVAMLLRAIG